jgi:hypothetical protein
MMWAIRLKGQMSFRHIGVNTEPTKPLLSLDRETRGLKEVDERLLESGVLPDWARRSISLDTSQSRQAHGTSRGIRLWNSRHDRALLSAGQD